MHIKSARRKFVTFIVGIGTATSASAYTFIFSPPARLPGSPESPDVTFTWDGTAPSLSEKDKFRNGAFDGQDDTDVMRTLITEAMASWNNVAGSYVRLNLAEDSDATADAADRVNAIVVSPTGNLNSAAFADPRVDRETGDPTDIIDCDITVGNKQVSVEFMLYALTHELGHCLGLGHAHDNYKSLMGYSRTPGNAELSADDKAGVIFLYGDPAYGDPKARELIGAGCGTVSMHASPVFPPILLFMLLLPLFFTSVQLLTNDD